MVQMSRYYKHNYFDGAFLVWLVEEKLAINKADWDKHVFEILEQHYAEYMGWALNIAPTKSRD